MKRTMKVISSLLSLKRPIHTRNLREIPLRHCSVKPISDGPFKNSEERCLSAYAVTNPFALPASKTVFARMKLCGYTNSHVPQAVFFCGGSEVLNPRSPSNLVLSMSMASENRRLHLGAQCNWIQEDIFCGHTPSPRRCSRRIWPRLRGDCLMEHSRMDCCRLQRYNNFSKLDKGCMAMWWIKSNWSMRSKER